MVDDGNDVVGGPARAVDGAATHLLGRTLALAGAWLPITFSSAVLLPQRVEAIVVDSSWSATYAGVSATGWASVVIGLTISGHLEDTDRLRRMGDRRTVILLAMLVLVAGSSLMLATTMPALVALWLATLLPSAFCVTLLAARLADCGASTVRAASAIGSAPVLAVLLGSVAVTAVSFAGGARFVLIAALAAATMLLGSAGAAPLSSSMPPTASSTASGASPSASALASAAAAELPVPLPPITDAAVRSALRRHRRLLAAVALVDTATVTFTFVVVPLVFLLPRTAAVTPGAYAERLVLIATACALVAVWSAPLLRGLRARPRLLFTLSGLVAATSLAAAPFVGAAALLLVVIAAGTAIGASNAATFGLFLNDPASHEQRATGLGLLNAMPSLPAALVPIAAIPLLRWSPDRGLTIVMVTAASAAAIGALMMTFGGRRP